MDRRRQIMGAGGLVIVAVLAFLVVRERRAFRRAAPGPHAAGVEHRLSPVLAAQEAPDGATPCETAYNALKAYEETALHANIALPFGALPAREVVIARCSALPEQEQLCLGPRYAAKNNKVCQPILDRFDAAKTIFGVAKNGASASASASGAK